MVLAEVPQLLPTEMRDPFELNWAQPEPAEVMVSVVVVAFFAVKFCRLDEPVAMIFAIFKAPVPVALAKSKLTK